jgi:hypothetical protein
MDKPQIRNLEVFPIQDIIICLRDPLCFSEQMLALSTQLFYLYTLMDGSCTRADLITLFSVTFGAEPDTSTINDLI